MSKLDFGVFKDFWNGHPNHLPLLRLRIQNNEAGDWNLGKSLDILDLISENHHQDLVFEGIHKLLNNEDWRPHLVATLASFKLSPDNQQKLIPSFWNRLEKGSWVSPQILAVLSIIDEDFESKGKEVLNTGFQVNFSQMNMAEHHSARGPEGSKVASEKVITSIKLLLKNQDDEFGWKGQLIQLIDSKRFKINTMQKKE